MLEWSYIISKAIVELCFGAVIGLALTAYLTGDAKYLPPILIVAGVCWAVVIVQLVIHRRSTGRMLRGRRR